VKIGIPIAEHVESLNASVATAIALYDWRRR
jgi:tRNA G18 (ribose-2'-O)-methylase SpoU